MPPSPLSSVYIGLRSERKEIRLLSICRTNDPTALLECDFQTFELNAAPPFDSVSYVWGDPKVTAEIKVGGISTQITVNLCAALKRLREKADVQWIWADALCINQNDSAEKNHQVLLMRQIYRRAGRVFSWLGEGDEDTHLAFALIERWADAILSTSPDLRSWPDGEAMRAALATVENPFDEQAWAALRSLFRKTYWQRIWIVQEVFLARQCFFICGANEILFHKILWTYRAWLSGDLRLTRLEEILKIGTYPDYFYPFMRIILELDLARVSIAEKDSNPPASHVLSSLPFLLKRASSLSATDLRDKIYGVLGLLNVEDLPIPVDYSKDVADAYTNVVWSLIQMTSRLDILTFGGIGTFGSLHNPTRHNLPSWMPDFREQDFDARFCDHTVFFDTLFFRASGETSAKCTLSSDLRRIRIEGVTCDEIAALAAPSLDAEVRLRRWLIFALTHQGGLNPCYASAQQTLFRTIIADHLWRGFESPDFLAGHLELQFFRMAVGFLSAVKLIHEERPLPHFGPRIDSEPRVEIDPETRQKLAAWFRHPTWQDEDDTYPRKAALIENFLGPPRSRSRLHWPETVEFNSEEDHATLLWFRPVFGNADSRCLFITRMGYIGLGPWNAQVGDKIFLPLGCSVPLMIRAAGENSKLIGDTYVCGMMQGEMVQKLEIKLNLESVVFE
jgi:Heterokaryon incompatibility protein (HET)